jgi:hypothetical protein
MVGSLLKAGSLVLITEYGQELMQGTWIYSTVSLSEWLASVVIATTFLYMITTWRR